MKYNLIDFLNLVNNHPQNEVKNSELNNFKLTDFKIAILVFIIKNYPYHEVFDKISNQLNYTSFQTFESLNYLEDETYIFRNKKGRYLLTNKSLKVLSDMNWDKVNISSFHTIVNLYNFNNKKVTKKKFPNYTNVFPIWNDENELKKFFEISIEEPLRDFTKKNYSCYKIKTKNRDRLIFKPSLHLKKIQQWILKNILINISLSKDCHSFIAERSIVTNAKSHLINSNSKMLKIDIHNFFHSIEFKQVFNLFRGIGYSSKLSEYLAILCTNENGNPGQGFPTSPQISNIIFTPLDYKIGQLCRNNNLVYTRYADDITISGESLKKCNLEQYIKSLSNILLTENFRINNNKTIFLNKQAQKRITGITLNNNNLAVPKKYKRYLEKELYFIEKFGLTQHMQQTNIVHFSNYKGYLYGICSFINQINPNLGSKYREQLDKYF